MSQWMSPFPLLSPFPLPGNIARAVRVGDRVSFTTLGDLGYMQGRVDPVDPTVQIVNGPGTYELSAVTLGSHMLAGVRRWRVVIVSESPVVLRVQTEAYEQTAGSLFGIYELNYLGRNFGPGQDAQYKIWDIYLKNIAAHWREAAGATSDTESHIPEQDVGTTNPWRSQLPPSLQE